MRFIQFLGGVPVSLVVIPHDATACFPLRRSGNSVGDQVSVTLGFLVEVSPAARREACCFKHLSCALPRALTASRRSRRQRHSALPKKARRLETQHDRARSSQKDGSHCVQCVQLLGGSRRGATRLDSSVFPLIQDFSLVNQRAAVTRPIKAREHRTPVTQQSIMG